jgi:hypothetical protein
MKSEQQPKMTRMLPDQEKQSHVTRVSGLRPAPLSSSFEDTQAFLQRAAAQLKVEDHANEAARDQVAAIIEQIIREHFKKSVIYDFPIEEEMKSEIGVYECETVSCNGVQVIAHARGYCGPLHPLDTRIAGH